MTEKTVRIALAPGAPSGELWDGRLAREGTVLTVTAEEFAILKQREPERWIVHRDEATTKE